MGVNLTFLRVLILQHLDEDGIENSEFSSSGDNPWVRIDQRLNMAEGMIGSFMIGHGAKSALILKSGSYSYSANSRDVPWSTIDPAGVLPGSKIYRIWDVTGGTTYPLPITIVDQDKADLQEGFGVLTVTRLGLPRAGMDEFGAIIYDDRLSILPVTNMARTLQFEYIPKFGLMIANPAVVSVLPNEASDLIAIRAAADLLGGQKGRDSSNLEAMYEREKWELINLLHKSRAGTSWKLRGRRRGP